MRILIFHGYLLDGTGSNVYNARLAAALAGLGHEVHLLCQDRHPERYRFVDAHGDWDAGGLRVRSLGRAGEPGRRGSCTVYRPNIGGLLPVYVADRYEGIEARRFAECSDVEIARYLEANVAAVAELAELMAPDIALANHLVMGPLILARGLDGRVPYAVKVHGSALEYTVKPEPDRFLAAAREGLLGAAGVLVGSRHTAASLWAALGEQDWLRARTRLGPPGVDTSRFRPREPGEAGAGVRALTLELRASAASAQSGHSEDASAQGRAGGSAELAGSQDAFARDDGAAASALACLDPENEVLVAFVGKLILSKGVDLLVAAWPLVLERVPNARLLIVGFGAYRSTLERLIGSLARGELEQARAIARAGRALEGETGRAAPLGHLLAFLDSLRGAAGESYLQAARALSERVVLSGRLEHDELAVVLPACEALVVPSTFPEAFGMVAAEAAACGTLPVSAAHSGLAEVSEVLAGAVPDEVAGLLTFPLDDRAVRAIAERLIAWLETDAPVRARTRAALALAVGERWSWEAVAGGVMMAARGQLDALAEA